jgi:hypothetical protein
MALVHYHPSQYLLPSEQSCVREKAAVRAPNVVGTDDDYTSWSTATLQLACLAWLPLDRLNISLSKPYEHVLNQRPKWDDEDRHARPIYLLATIKDSSSKR